MEESVKFQPKVWRILAGFSNNDVKVFVYVKSKLGADTRDEAVIQLLEEIAATHLDFYRVEHRQRQLQGEKVDRMLKDIFVEADST